MPQAGNTNHPKKLADRYRVDAPIGEGAHASTWRGWDDRLDRPVAIKMLHNHLAQDPVFVQRFQAEAKVAASVSQGNVVDVYDFGQQDGTLYIVMQFIDGEDLKALIQRSAPLPVRDVRRIIGNVLDGLNAIHAAGIVHRDIKPQNVLIGKDGVARVTDFGIADVQSTAGLTGEGLTIGTADYMAPEQAQGLPLTPSADLYSTGVMLYEMLTGTLPYKGNTSRETMLQHINGELTPASVRLPNRGITPTIDAVIGQSLAKDPSRRFGSARAMKLAVGQSLATQSTASQSQVTNVIQAAPQRPQAPVYQQPYQEPVYEDDAGAGLNSAFKAILFLLFIGALGVAAWGALQMMDSDDFNLPSFLDRQEQTTPTATVPPAPTAIPEIEPAPIEQIDDVIEPNPTDIPTELPPTEVPPTDVPPTDVPVQPTEAPAEIEPPVQEVPTAPEGQDTVPTDEAIIEPIG